MNLSDVPTEALRKELNLRTTVKHPTYCIEGVWSGYTSSQSRVCFRMYTKSKKCVHDIENLGFIRFTDGTTLNFKTKTLAFREKKDKELKNYTGLINDCIAYGVKSVAELNELKNKNN